MTSWFTKLPGLLELFLESNCAICLRSATEGFCQACQQQVKRCQLPDPQQFWHEPLPVFAWGLYGGALKRAIAALKYNHSPQLSRPLGYWLAQAWLNSSPSAIRNLTVVPIPLHPDKQQQRGFNQAELLAEAFCQRAGLPLQRHGLIRTRATEALFSLSPEAREQTLTEAFRVSKGLLQQRKNRAVLLLDDIYTTGATMRSAAQALQQQQIEVYGVVAIAKAKGTKEQGSGLRLKS